MLKLEFTDNAPVGIIQNYSKKEWVSAELFIKYIKQFVKIGNCSKKRKVLLIFDGRKTLTKSLELIDYGHVLF